MIKKFILAILIVSNIAIHADLFCMKKSEKPIFKTAVIEVDLTTNPPAYQENNTESESRFQILAKKLQTTYKTGHCYQLAAASGLTLIGFGLWSAAIYFIIKDLP